MRALVVDDEAPARRRLTRMLEAIAGVEVVGQREDADGVLRALELSTPDVIFLDVRMPGIDGVRLAQQHGELPPVVFVTAYDEYAVRAFELDAVDYLLKPVRPERLQVAVARVRARAQAASTELARIAAGAPPRIVSATRGVIRVFDARAITRFWSRDKYTSFFADGAEQLTEESLSTLGQRLADQGFLRVHRGELVRTDAIRELRLIDGGHEIALSDGQVARVSRRALAAIKLALGLSRATL